MFLTDPLRVVRSAVTLPATPLPSRGTAQSHIPLVSPGTPPPPPISSLPFTGCFKGSDFQRIKLMQKKKSVWPSLLSLFLEIIIVER